jgi:hypothetical protein
LVTTFTLLPWDNPILSPENVNRDMDISSARIRISYISHRSRLGIKTLEMTSLDTDFENSIPPSRMFEAAPKGYQLFRVDFDAQEGASSQSPIAYHQ